MPTVMNLQPWDVPPLEFVDYVTKHQHGLYLCLCAVVFMTYDLILTFPEEVRFVWMVQSRSSWSTVMFVLTRYLPLVTFFIRFLLLHSDMVELLHGSPSCRWRVPFILLIASGIISVIVAEIVLLLRVYVLYSRSRVVGIFISTLLFVGLCTAGVIGEFRPTTGIPFAKPPPKTLSRCPLIPPSELFWMMSLAWLVETIGFGLLVFRAYSSWRDSLSTPILSALLRHGAAYYGVVFLALTFTIVSTVVQPLFLPISDANFIVPILSVACNRLILSLRGLYFKQEIHDGDSVEDTLTTFVAGMGPEPDASRLNLSAVSQISAVVDAEHSQPRIEDEETVAGTSMRAVCGVVTRTSSTQKGQ